MKGTIPMSWRSQPWPLPSGGPPSWRVRAVAGGVHQAGSLDRHASRILPVHELIVVHRGALPIAEEDEDRFVRAGEWILLRAELHHRGTSRIDSSTWFHWLCLKGDIGAASEGPTPTGTVEDRGMVQSLFEALLADQARGQLTRDSADAYATVLLHHLCPERATQGRSRPAEIHRAVVDEVAARLSHPELTTRNIAATIGYHPDHLGRVFRAVAGETVIAYIHRQRVAQARELIANTELSIEAIVESVGFTDPRYFRRVFVRRVGVTPTQFRRLYR